jgi:hypothetical protein
LDHVLILGERHLQQVIFNLLQPDTHAFGVGQRRARSDGLFNELGPWSRRLCYPDCIIAMPGYDFREEQDPKKK